MAKLRVAINGFGRIGRVLTRAGFEKFDIVGINSLDSIDGVAHLLKYDSTHGIFGADINHDEKNLIINGKKIPVSKSRNPLDVPFKDWGVDMVLECSGAFKKKEDFQQFITAGAKRVMVSAPADGADQTFVYGVNHKEYNPSKDFIVSNASCTTNCLAPLVKVLHETFEVVNGTMLTVHSYTNDQKILDAPHKDLRRARSAAISMIPTTTGAAKSVGKVIPAMKGKIDGLSIRVPTPNVSLVDFTFNSAKEMTKESINEALIAASQGGLKGILACEKKELVSVDFNGNTHSSIVDLPSTMVMGGKTAKVLSWYDNEAGFSERMVDLALYMAEKGI